MTGTEILYYAGATIGTFLVGVNLAFLLHLGTRLVGWFAFKVGAVTLLLAYTVFSLRVGHPSTIRASIGLLAMLADLAAIVWMWGSITRMRASGKIGLVPILRDNDSGTS